MRYKFQNLPLRSGVGVVVLNNNNRVLVGKRLDNQRDYWQMPQGGVNEKENYYEAALRELKEETSIISVKLIKEIDGFTSYNLPDSLLGIIWKWRFKGQKQKWFVFRFEGKDNEINLKTEHPEFIEWKWLKIENITDKVVDFKFHVYEKLKRELESLTAN